jgi:hypothetical protein
MSGANEDETSMSTPKEGAVVWKHIGLHSYAVGMFAFNAKKMIWKSDVTGRDDDHEVATTRSIPASNIAVTLWTVFGKSGLLRVQTRPTEKNSTIKHELRFDGFPPNDFGALNEALQTKYNVTLKQHTLWAAGTHYGLMSVKFKNLVFRHCVLDNMNKCCFHVAHDCHLLDNENDDEEEEQ